MTVLSSWIGGINHVHLPTLSPWRRPAKVVNRPIATGTRMEILATEHTYRRGATPTSGQEVHAHAHTCARFVNVQGPMKGLTCFIARLIREYGGGRGGRAIGKRAQQATPIRLLITVSLVNAPLPPSPMGSKRCADVRPPRVSVYRICIFTRFFFFRNSVPRSFFFSLETRMREIDQIIFMAIL